MTKRLSVEQRLACVVFYGRTTLAVLFASEGYPVKIRAVRAERAKRLRKVWHGVRDARDETRARLEGAIP